MKKLRQRLIYTWDYGFSRGVEFWPGVDLYITSEESEVGKAFNMDAGRLRVSWRRGD